MGTPQASCSLSFMEPVQFVHQDERAQFVVMIFYFLCYFDFSHEGSVHDEFPHAPVLVF